MRIRIVYSEPKGLTHMVLGFAVVEEQPNKVEKEIRRFYRLYNVSEWEDMAKAQDAILALVETEILKENQPPPAVPDLSHLEDLGAEKVDDAPPVIVLKPIPVPAEPVLEDLEVIP